MPFDLLIERRAEKDLKKLDATLFSLKLNRVRSCKLTFFICGTYVNLQDLIII